MKFRNIEAVQADINRRLEELYDQCSPDCGSRFRQSNKCSDCGVTAEINRLQHLLIAIDDALYTSNIHAIKVIIQNYNQ